MERLLGVDLAGSRACPCLRVLVASISLDTHGDWGIAREITEEDEDYGVFAWQWWALVELFYNTLPTSN